MELPSISGPNPGISGRYQEAPKHPKSHQQRNEAAHHLTTPIKPRINPNQPKHNLKIIRLEYKNYRPSEPRSLYREEYQYRR